MAVVKQSTMIALWGDGRLGEVGRIRRGAWAPSLLVCGPWKYSDLRANAVFLGQEIQCPCCGTRRQPSQEPGTWHRVVLGCRSAARHGPAFRTASLQGPDRVERAPGVAPLACSITCRVRVGDHPPPPPPATPLSPSPLPEARSCQELPSWRATLSGWCSLCLLEGRDLPASRDKDTKEGGWLVSVREAQRAQRPRRVGTFPLGP